MNTTEKNGTSETERRNGITDDGTPRQEFEMTDRARRNLGSMRERLERAARRVTSRDIDDLETSVPGKLEESSLTSLKKELDWVKSMLDRVAILYRMVRDREYAIDWKVKAMAAAALIYFVLPTDLTPDFIPGIGYIDDALVLTTLWKLAQEQIEEYLAARGESSPADVPPPAGVPGDTAERARV